MVMRGLHSVVSRACVRFVAVSFRELFRFLCHLLFVKEFARGNKRVGEKKPLTVSTRQMMMIMVMLACVQFQVCIHFARFCVLKLSR